MATKKDVDKKFQELEKLLNPSDAPDFLSIQDMNELGTLSMSYDATYRDFLNSNQKSKDIKVALKSFSDIEKKAKRILRIKNNNFLKYIIIAFVLYVIIKILS